MDYIEDIRFIGFNQDHTCIALATAYGFRVLNTYPVQHYYGRDFQGDFSIVQQLYRTNLIFLVGASRSLIFPPNKLVIWDDQVISVVSELRFNTNIQNVQLRRDIFAVVFENCIFVYRTTDLTLKDLVPTFHSKKGICRLNSIGENALIAYLDPKKGSVSVKSYYENLVKTFPAFERAIGFLEMNQDGSLIACASKTGKVIKVFNCESKELLFQLHRGIDKAVIFSIAFHPTSEWIAVSSDRGTIHVYHMADSNNRDVKFIRRMIPNYREYDVSYSQYKIKGCKKICCFAKDNSTLIILTDDGEYYAVNYLEPGECKLMMKCNLLEIK